METPSDRRRKRLNAKSRSQREAEYRFKVQKIEAAMRRGMFPSIRAACAEFGIALCTYEKYSQ